jgi:hypothetical protein
VSAFLIPCDEHISELWKRRSGAISVSFRVKTPAPTVSDWGTSPSKTVRWYVTCWLSQPRLPYVCMRLCGDGERHGKEDRYVLLLSITTVDRIAVKLFQALGNKSRELQFWAV